MNESDVLMLDAGRPLRYGWYRICCFKTGCLRDEILSNKYLKMALRELAIERSFLERSRAQKAAELSIHLLSDHSLLQEMVKIDSNPDYTVLDKKMLKD